MACVLKQWSLYPRHRDRRCPWCRVRRRVDHGELIINRLCIYPSETLDQALASVFSFDGTVAIQTTAIDEGQEILRPRRVTLNELARRALSQFNEAQDRLQQGDWTGYGTSLQQLENVLRRLADDANRQE